jgi:hypothetical protein
MKKIIFTLIVLVQITWAQTKVSGIVVDAEDKPISFANIVFKGSTSGVVSDDNGKFYMESDKTYTALYCSFVGYQRAEIPLDKSVNFNLKIVLKSEQVLQEVVIFKGKTSKKNNPAIDILRKIWARKKSNGLKMFHQYEYEKYEKVEFDLNTIDSSFMNSKVFKGLEFVFSKVDTSDVTGKTYLPIFINESIYDVYGDNKIGKEKEVIKANKNSGLGNGDGVNTFIKDLYSDYNIYDNYITFFDKNFTSPLSRTGIDTYNYVLSDSSYIDKKWCYNIVFYPRRKGELTFKGNFWVNDTTYAIKKIEMSVTKSANINWVKDIFLEQEFDVENDSVFILTRDYMMSDFSINKKEKSQGVYGKRTTLYRNHKYNQEKPEKFYREEVNYVDNKVYNRSNEYWEENRFEKLNKDEIGIYKMLDTLKTVKKFKQAYNLVTILGSGYINYKQFDYGPIFSTFGYNYVEGLRLRVGGRTYFGPNDKWRLQAYTAYGFKDDKFKYGVSGKWMVDKKNRIILAAGNRRDVEQIGANLTGSNDVLGRSFATTSFLSSGTNGKLSNVNLSMFSAEIEPVKNLIFRTEFTHKKLSSASDIFNMDYFTNNTYTTTSGEVKQSEVSFQIDFTPNKKSVGYGVERLYATNPFSRIYANVTQGFKGLLDSDFDYTKLQLYYKQPMSVAGLGKSNFTLELGKTFGQVPLGLLSVVPGNQSYFSIENTFSNLNYYEFVTDQYATFNWEHNFQGKIFSRVPKLRKLNLREIIGIRAAYGTISDENIKINASDIQYLAPTKPYWEYGFGIGNIFKVFRLDFAWRGNYRDVPETSNFTIKGSFGFYF